MLTLPRMAENEEPAPDDVRVLDPRTLRGLAHPLRMRLLTALREYGPATASQLADRLGESSGATSYHLRQLATYGFVEDDPSGARGGSGGGRRRTEVRAGTPTSSWPTPTRPYGGRRTRCCTRWPPSTRRRCPPFWAPCTDGRGKWRAASDLSDFYMRLTPELAREMRDKVHELIESYREKEVDRDTEGSAPYRVHLHAFPREED
ncbi:Transcriptional regulator OS=Streptomyces antimycoticus OX=68175 GN=SANT12839_039950 PE=4 SV=1 [Streptomyces antimycoticus]